MSDKDMKDLLLEQAKTFEALKEANDQVQAEIEKLGSADVVLVEKVEKINASLDKFEDLNQRVTKAEQERKAAEEAAKEAAEAAAKAAEEKDAATKEQMDRIETALNRTDRGGASDEESEAKEAKEAFVSYLRKGKDNLSPDEIKVLTVGQDTQAGYLAPEEYVREIIKAAIVFSPIRTIARVRSTSAKAITVPRRTGTFGAVWVAEQGSRSETTGLTYGLEELPTHESTATVDISSAMLEDSVFDLQAELQEEFSEQFGVTEGTAFVSGSAVGQPEGFMTNGDVSSTNSGSAANIKDTNGQADGIINMIHALKEAYAANATFVLNRTTLGAVRKLKDVSSGAGTYLWQPGVALGIPNTILGSPYIEATDMDNEGANTFPIAFGDFRRGYWIVDRISLSVLQDPYTQAGSGNIRFIARKRVAAQVVLPEAIRKLKCSA